MSERILFREADDRAKQRVAEELHRVLGSLPAIAADAKAKNIKAVIVDLQVGSEHTSVPVWEIVCERSVKEVPPFRIEERDDETGERYERVVRDYQTLKGRDYYLTPGGNLFCHDLPDGGLDLEDIQLLKTGLENFVERNRLSV